MAIAEMQARVVLDVIDGRSKLPSMVRLLMGYLDVNLKFF